ncbi:MAG: hypothetical protein J0J06_01015 [Sphingomonas sp.]|nr:hypothetical protein [Sphingomonas sp.]
MLALSIAVMLAAGAKLPNYTLPPARPSARTRCTGKCASRYRLASSDDNQATSKYRALNEDGTDCNVTRAKICRKQPRTWVKAAY